MAEQAYAYVTLIPVATGFQKAVAGELSGLGGVGAGLGDKAGAGFKSSFGSAIRGFAAPLATAFAATGLVNFTKNIVTAASDLNEVGTAVEQVFGSASGTLKAYAKTAAGTMGQSQTQFLDAAKTFGIFGQAAGLATDANAQFSTELVKLASDLASFNNTSVDEAINSLGSALRGESEPMRKYGVMIDENALKSQALEMKIYSGSGALTQQQKILAAHELILKKTGTQQGDFARTADGMANSQRILTATWDNAQAMLGQALLPAMTNIAQTMIPIINEYAPKLGKALKDIPFAAIANGFIKFVEFLLKNDNVILTFAGSFKALSVAVELFGVSSKVASVGVALLNGAMVANPVGAMVMALALAAGSFVLLNNAINDVNASMDKNKKLMDAYSTPAELKKRQALYASMGWQPVQSSADAARSQAASGARYAGQAAAWLASQKSTPDLLAGITDVSGSTKKTAADLAKARADMIRSFKADILRDLGIEMTKDVQSAKDYSTKIMEWISKSFLDGTLSKKTAQAAHAMTRAYTAQLLPLVAANEDVLKKLEAAQETLTNKAQERLDFIAKLTDQFGSKLALDEESTATSAIQNLKDRIARTKQLTVAMQTLSKMGLSGDLYQQIIDTGNLEFAQSVIAGGDAAVSELNALAVQANETAKQLATQAGDILFNKGIEVAQGVVDGLKAKNLQLENQMKSLARAFASELALLIGNIVLPTTSTVPMSPTGVPVVPGKTLADEAAYQASQAAFALAHPATPEQLATDFGGNIPRQTVIYNAAPNVSLDAEKELLKAISISGMLAV